MKFSKQGLAMTLTGLFALALAQGAGAQVRTIQSRTTQTQATQAPVRVMAVANTTTATKNSQETSARIRVSNTSNTQATTNNTQGTAAPSATAKPVSLVKPSNEGLRFNFRGVALDTVLEYLSKSAGLIIVRPAGQSVQGRVDVESATPVTKEEAVNLLNNVLKKNGFGAVLNERTLEIFPISQTYNPNIPVEIGNKPQEIKKTDEMVTMIIPVRYTTANALMQNLEPLLPQYAVISTNDASNAVVLTATRADVRHIVEVISALDTSISDISTLKVFMLEHADATEMAKLLSDLFKPAQSSGGGGGSPFGGRGGSPFGGRGGGGPMAMMFGAMAGGGRGGRGGGGSSADSAARQAAQQVTAVADARTNALVVSAPNDTMPTIEELIKQIDTSTAQLCEIRVFALKYADATQMATLINNVYQPLQQQSGTGTSGFGGGSSRRMSFGGRGFGGGGFGGGSTASSSSATPGSKRSQESIVLAVPDIRTNSVIVNADKDIMEQIAPMVQSLDNDPSRDKKVFVYPLKYADAEKTASMLQNMFGDTSRSNRNQNRSNLGVFSTQNNNSNSLSSRNRTSSSNGSGGGGSRPTGLF